MSPKLEKETAKVLEEAVPLFCLCGGRGGGVGRDTKGEAGRPSAWSLSRTWERKCCPVFVFEGRCLKLEYNIYIGTWTNRKVFIEFH